MSGAKQKEIKIIEELKKLAGKWLTANYRNYGERKQVKLGQVKMKISRK